MVLFCSCCTPINVMIYGKKRYFPSIEVNEDSLAANYTLVLYPVLIKVTKKNLYQEKVSSKPSRNR